MKQLTGAIRVAGGGKKTEGLSKKRGKQGEKGEESRQQIKLLGGAGGRPSGGGFRCLWVRGMD